MRLNHHTISIRMPIPERVLKPESVIREEEAGLKQDRSAFRPMWLRTIDRFNIPYKALAYSTIIHVLAIVGLIHLLS